jgi:mono/diheme cytochrome c family protein
MRGIVSFAGAIGITFVLAGVGLGAEAPSPERGRLFAQRNCAVCHAIAATGDSPYSAAPPFRAILQRSPPDALVKLLTEGLAPDHRAYREMQYFVLSQYEAADLAAYWKTLHADAPDDR